MANEQMAGRRRCNRETDLRSNTVSARAVAGKQPRLWNRPGGALIVFALLATGTSSAGGQEKAPRHPPEPFRVFVDTSDPADAALKANLEEAMPMVRERVERRRKWFQLTGSAETADITLRVINYRTAQVMLPKLEGMIIKGQVSLAETSEIVEFHYVDAVALAGEARENLTGLDERDYGPSLRNAASHLAEELERFCKDNYGALEQLRATAGPRERRNGGASPPAKNGSPPRP